MVLRRRNNIKFCEQANRPRALARAHVSTDVLRPVQTPLVDQVLQTRHETAQEKKADSSPLATPHATRDYLPTSRPSAPTAVVAVDTRYL